MTQERAVRTRRAILEAAAITFDRRGYEAATITEILKEAGVTKGALYFHFPSKEALADAVLAEPAKEFVVPARQIKIQELIDTALVHAYRVRTNPLVRASVRLSLDQRAEGIDRTGPFLRWRETALTLLSESKDRHELLAHIDPAESADIYVGTFAGLQSMSHVLDNYAHLEERISVLQRHLMPAICVPAVLAQLDFTPTLGERLAQQAITEPAEALAT
ncbi:ScbR family autoregulator-binding transcription factor [Streptomyces sp. NPDC050560]|uniref:ScbR family autoregulator-binding transcription factor n=1 Tax=Streptomyces sp. NPDC050560 TaxID=3365630 RepID=UPI0037B72673